MNKPLFSPQAETDLAEISEYISTKLGNPQAARRTLLNIKKRTAALRDFPLIGAPLTADFDGAGDYRYLVCGNYLALYRVPDGGAVIDRILYGKRDYIKILLGGIDEN